jgi:aryl-phospho-beta-D-glucosidase BglC (GH1 family)
MLQVVNGKIVNHDGQPVQLRGTCVGGWLHMENFIDGYPGAEYSLKRVMAETIGADKAHFYFERLLDYFFTEDDVIFIKSTGANVVRIALNYRQFERDDHPFHYLEDGFARLDQAVDWCAKHGLYVILDLHAVQGWQNTDWHSDNANRASFFWTHSHFQDRFVALWEVLAARYKGVEAIAGYNVMNEPATGWPNGRFSSDARSKWKIINAVYRRVVAAIRAIDPDHIIFLEGDYYSSKFDGLEAPFADNLVYSSHNYTMAGFGPGAYPGEIRGEHWDKARIEDVLVGHEGFKFAKKYNVPLWVGEFGSVYNGRPEETADRYQALDDQISLFNQYGIHWTTWVYKDIGVMSWATVDPGSEYMRRTASVRKAQTALRTELWMGWLPRTQADVLLDELAEFAAEMIDDPEIDPVGQRRYLVQATLAGYMGGLLQPAYANVFKGLTEVEIDRVLQSFAFANCQTRQPLVEIIKKHT